MQQSGVRFWVVACLAVVAVVILVQMSGFLDCVPGNRDQCPYW